MKPTRAMGPMFVLCLIGEAACGSGLRDSHNDVGSTFLLTRMGGRIDFAELHLEVPASAIDRDIWITVRRSPLDDSAILGDAFALEPETVVFARPLTLTLDLPGSLPVDTGRVVLAGFSPPTWVKIPNSAPSASQVTGEITQLATFAAVISCGNNDDCVTGRCDTGVCQGDAPPVYARP